MLTLKTQEWILAQIPGAAELIDYHPLVGGISAKMYKLTLKMESDHDENHLLSVVLRLIDSDEWLQEEPLVTEHEAKVLQKLEEISDLSFQAPRSLGYDVNGDQAERPAHLMTCIEGCNDLPAQPSIEWVEQLAVALIPLHRTPIEANSFPYTYMPYHRAEYCFVPTWTSKPKEWQLLIDYRKLHQPANQIALIHRDYHPTNVMWDKEQGRLVGIVDWINGCIGPIGVDIGHCRINLVQLYGPEVANQFLEAYLKHNAAYEYDPYWDICCLFDMSMYGEVDVYEGWTALGFQGLTTDLIIERIDQYVEELVQIIAKNGYNRTR